MRRILLASTLACLPLPGMAGEDQITLGNKDLFFGKVIALKDGLIEVQTAHSDTPLKVLNKDLVTLRFGDTASGELPKNSQQLNLRNGDRFPGEVVALSETHLSFNTWFAGQLEIPRSMVDSVYFGVTPQETIFNGPKGIDSWTQSATNRWTFEEDSLLARNKGFIGKNLELPEQFIFSTAISWENSPNLRIHLCSDKTSPDGNKVENSYLIQINTAGIEVRRVMPEGTKGQKYHVLVTHQEKLSQLESKSVRVELRVDRKQRTVQLYLNDQKMELALDPAEPPTGTCVMFESVDSGARNIRVDNLRIQKWDSKTQGLHVEPRAADDQDTLSVGDGDRFSGQILSFSPDGPEKQFSVKTALSPDPVQIPLAHCAVMYFAKGQTPPSKGHYQLDLRTGGRLTLSGIQLGEGKLSATHPWLGQIEVDRRIMQSIGKGK